jgi:hypothetical protein
MSRLQYGLRSCAARIAKAVNVRIKIAGPTKPQIMASTDILRRDRLAGLCGSEDL